MFDPTPGLLELRRAQVQGLRERNSNALEDALFALCNLADSRLLIPIEAAAPDWRLALRQAEIRLRREQLSRALPLAYDDDRQRHELGLAQVPPPPPRAGATNPKAPGISNTPATFCSAAGR